MYLSAREGWIEVTRLGGERERSDVRLARTNRAHFCGIVKVASRKMCTG
jgi:hypothetical protein